MWKKLWRLTIPAEKRWRDRVEIEQYVRLPCLSASRKTAMKDITVWWAKLSLKSFKGCELEEVIQILPFYVVL